MDSSFVTNRKGGIVAMVTFSYVVRDAFRQLFRHWGVTFLTLITAAAVFFLVGSSALFSLTLRQVAGRVQSDQVVRAFAETEGAARSVAQRMQGTTGVQSVKLMTPDQAMESLRSRLGAQTELLSMAGENPMPWTVEITVAHAAQVNAVAGALAQDSQVSDFIYAGATAQRLARLSATATKVAAAVVVLCLLVSGLVLYNTLRLSIEHRRREISVMLLVGSTRTHIMAPFVLQGMFLGFVGALIACLVLVPCYEAVLRQLNAEISFLNLALDPSGLLVLCELLLCGGLALGWLCSFIAAGRRVSAAAKPL